MNVRLREVKRSDIEEFFDQQNDEEAHNMVGITSNAPDDKQAFLKKWDIILTDKAVTIRTILYEDRIAGNVRCFFAPWSEKQEVGYWIGREFWRMGVATEALREFLKIEKRRPLYATVAKHNVASIRVLEKCGFRRIVTETVKLDDGRQIEESRFELG